MKKILGLICLLFIATYADAEDEKIVKSSISKVTVYSQGAQIFRNASYTISTGVSQVIIEGVSPQIDPKSLQVKATGSHYNCLKNKIPKDRHTSLPPRAPPARVYISSSVPCWLQGVLKWWGDSCDLSNYLIICTPPPVALPFHPYTS